MKKLSNHINTRLDGFLYVLKHDKLSEQFHIKLRFKIWNEIRNLIYSQIKQDIL